MRQNIVTIVLGVISSIVFAGLIFLLNKLKVIEPLKYRRSLKRIKESGIVTFYSQRSSFTKDAGPIGDYVKRAKKDVYYIGFWLSNGLKHQDLSEAIIEQVNKGVHFYFCVLDPNSPLMDYYSVFFGESKDLLLSQINLTIETLQQIRERLQYDRKQLLTIKTHSELITTTFWVIDPNEKKSMIQLDHKINGLPRHYTYGFQIEKKSSNTIFYEGLVNSNMKIISEGEDISEKQKAP